MLKLTPFAISGLLICLPCFPLAFFVWFKGRGKVAHYFAWNLMAVAVWGIGATGIGLNPGPELAWYFHSIAFIGVIHIPVFYMHAVMHMIQSKYLRPVMIAVYTTAWALSLTCLFKQEPFAMFIADTFWYMYDQYYVIKGSIYYTICFVWWQVLVAITTYLLLRYYMAVMPEKKTVMKCLLVGFPMGFIGGTSNFFQSWGLEIYPWGNFGVPFYVLIIGYAIFQYKFLDISFVLRKGVVYSLLIAIVSGMYFVTILLFEPVISRVVGEAGTASGLLAAILLGVVYAPMRLRLEFFVDQTIFRGYHQQITHQNQMIQEELARTEKFTTMSKITEGVIEEINTPLKDINSYSKEGLSKLENKEFVMQAAVTIDQQVDVINELLQKLLKFSNPEALALQNASIHNVIDDVLDILKKEFEEKKIELVSDFQTKGGEFLKIDPAQIRQALYNLCHYSAQSMAETGCTLVIHTGLKHASLVRQEKSDSQVEKFFEVIIKGTGKGIPQEKLATIFDPFHGGRGQAEEKTGLELSIAHRIIKDHGGYIFVESEQEKGTTFTVELPINR